MFSCSFIRDFALMFFAYSLLFHFMYGREKEQYKSILTTMETMFAVFLGGEWVAWKNRPFLACFPYFCCQTIFEKFYDRAYFFDWVAKDVKIMLTFYFENWKYFENIVAGWKLKDEKICKGNHWRSIGYCPHLGKSPLQPFQPAQQSHCTLCTLCWEWWIGCSGGFHRCGQCPIHPIWPFGFQLCHSRSLFKIW